MNNHIAPSAAMLITLAGSCQAFATGLFPAQLELSSIDGTNGFVINGMDAEDSSGFCVSSAGDVNGDGIDDLIIGANGADPNGERSGESYVIFGGKDIGAGAFFELSSLDGTNGFVLKGIDEGDTSGVSVAGAGDVNGDGIDDLIIGARFADPDSHNGAGESYVVFGGQGVGASGSIELSSLNGTNGYILSGINAGASSGVSVSSAGDVNGDNVDDIIIGAPFGQIFAGESYVVFGGVGVGASGSIPLSSLTGSNGFVLNSGGFASDKSGYSVSEAGDVNGDGISDIIIGARDAFPNGDRRYAGETYVVFGSAGVGASGSIEFSSLNGTNGFVLKGIDWFDGSGWAVSCAGDVNGDGVDDIIIGAHRTISNPKNVYAGETYVVFGGPAVGVSGSIELSSLNGPNGFILSGIGMIDRSGSSVSSAGDVNSDGIDDIIIGAYRANPNGVDRAGETYVVFGSPGVGASGSVDFASLNGINGFVLNGVDALDYSGWSVSSAGDVNGDGIDDLIIGANQASPNGTRSGESYVVFGRGLPPSEATIIVVPTHGQIPSLRVEQPPEWLSMITTRANTLTCDINTLRTNAGLAPIDVRVIPGVWNDLVVDGFADVIAGRFYWFYSESSLGGSIGSLVYALLGEAVEQRGRRTAAPTYGIAGVRIAQQINTVVEQVRSAHGTDYPVYIDLIGHSRGGLAGHHIALALHAIHGYTSDSNIHVSFTAVDAIDTSGPFPSMPSPLTRPLAYAGELLSEFRPLNPVADRRSNFYAEYGLISGDFSWFGDGFFSFIAKTFGAQLDKWFVLRGYPLGRSRPEILPNTDLLIPGSSHTTSIEMLASDFSTQALLAPPSEPYSLVLSTYFGDLILDPLHVYEPTETGATQLMRTSLAQTSTAGNLLADGAAESACEVLEAAQYAVGDMVFRDNVPEDMMFILDDIDAAVAGGFPPANAWSISQGTPTVQCGVVGDTDAAFVLDGVDAITQTLDSASMGLDQIQLDIDAMLLSSESVLSVHIIGQNLDEKLVILPPSARGVQERFTTSVIVERRATDGCTSCPDQVTVMSDGALVFDVAAAMAVKKLIGDIDGNGSVNSADLAILLAAWGNPSADLNSDGITDAADLAILIAAWTG